MDGREGDKEKEANSHIFLLPPTPLSTLLLPLATPVSSCGRLNQPGISPPPETGVCVREKEKGRMGGEKERSAESQPFTYIPSPDPSKSCRPQPPPLLWTLISVRMSSPGCATRYSIKKVLPLRTTTHLDVVLTSRQGKANE